MKRLRDPRYGMVVSDGTGTWMLIVRRTPGYSGGDESLVWYATKLGGPLAAFSLLSLLLLDPDQFGEVEE